MAKKTYTCVSGHRFFQSEASEKRFTCDLCGTPIRLDQAAGAPPSTGGGPCDDAAPGPPQGGRDTKD